MRIYWLFVDEFGAALLLLAYALPFLLAALAVRYDKRRLRPGNVPHLTVRSCGGCLIGTSLCFVLMFVTRCGIAPAGEGFAAQSWLERTAPIVASLERFGAEQDSFPVFLSALAPRYIPDSALSAVPRDSSSGLEYWRDGSGYVLRFHYRLGNQCTYRRREKRWSCVQESRPI